MFTFCPPGPEDLLNEMSNKFCGIVSASSFASQVRALVSSSSVALVFAVLLAYVRQSKPVHDGRTPRCRRNPSIVITYTRRVVREMMDASASFDDGEPPEPKHVHEIVLASSGPSFAVF